MAGSLREALTISSCQILTHSILSSGQNRTHHQLLLLLVIMELRRIMRTASVCVIQYLLMFVSNCISAQQCPLPSQGMYESLIVRSSTTLMKLWRKLTLQLFFLVSCLSQEQLVRLHSTGTVFLPHNKLW